jgi:Beta protein
MQLRLLRAEGFNPLPQGAGHYVAALQTKKGELEALAHTSPQTWSRLTPLIQILGTKNPKGPLKAPTVRNWVKNVASAVGDHPFLMDILRLRPAQTTLTPAGGQPVLECLYQAARKRDLQFVPVFPVGDASPSYLNLVRDATLHDGRGVALRWNVVQTMPPPGSTLTDLLSKTLTTLETDFTSADLLLDLGYLSPDVDLPADDIAASVNEAAKAGAWRNIVLLGTSMPATLGCIPEGEVGAIPRREWELWSALSNPNFKLERLPSYGDYAIQHPKPPQDDSGMGMRANIRYTTKNVTLIARGRGAVVQEGKQQYSELCRQLTKQPEFAGGDFTWGDRIIQGCAEGMIPPGAQGLWRAVGTSHHLRLVTDQLPR